MFVIITHAALLSYHLIARLMSAFFPAALFGSMPYLMKRIADRMVPTCRMATVRISLLTDLTTAR